jgi:hypothetical protein
MNDCKVLIGKLDGRRPLGKPNNGYKNSMKMDLKEILCMNAHWINLS